MSSIIPPNTAYCWERYILQSELPEPVLDGLEAILVDENLWLKLRQISLQA